MLQFGKRSSEAARIGCCCRKARSWILIDLQFGGYHIFWNREYGSQGKDLSIAHVRPPGKLKSRCCDLVIKAPRRPGTCCSVSKARSWIRFYFCFFGYHISALRQYQIRHYWKNLLTLTLLEIILRNPLLTNFHNCLFEANPLLEALVSLSVPCCGLVSPAQRPPESVVAVEKLVVGSWSIYNFANTIFSETVNMVAKAKISRLPMCDHQGALNHDVPIW